VITQQLQADLLETAELQKLRILEESQSLKDLIDSSRVNAYTLVAVRDPTGKIADFRFKSMTPQFRQHLLSQQPRAEEVTVSELYPHFRQDLSFQHYCDTLLHGRANSLDLLYPETPSGQWWHKTITRLSADEVLITMIDQTHIKRVQLQLEQSIDALKRSNVNLEEFAYAASHDLQEPLRKIQTFCTMLHTRLGESSDSQSVALLARMQSATVRMRLLIEDLLQYSRLPLGSDSFETVCLDSVIEESLSKVADEISVGGGTLTISGLEPVWGSSTQLQLLFSHLLDNAVKFAHKERPLQVRVTGRIVTAAEAALEPAHGSPSRMYLQVEVSDNGTGFEQQYAERMFQIFQRLHGRSEATGTGVGLSMVQKIVLNHQGRITATGIPGTGATFTFWLVLAADPSDCP
jgi:light-regulated signal transduction histidine kinase (bacteriophytochrome)